MPTTQESPDYAEILTTKRILYLPSCVVIEMMTTLYSEIFAISLSDKLHGSTGEILNRMHRMRTNLRATADAYKDSRVQLFVGDWREDKLRARRVFFNIMSRLGYIVRMIKNEDRNLLYEAIEELTAEWIALDRAMDEKAKTQRGHTTCRYFRNSKPDKWKQTMANIILTLDEDADYGEADGLVLVCFERIKRLFLAAIESIERRQGKPGKFNPERILVISREDVPFSCTMCSEMADSLGAQGVGDEYPERADATAILAMPGSSCPVRLRKHETDAEPRRKPHSTMQWIRAALGGETRGYTT